MWLLRRPTLTDAFNDIPMLIAESAGILTNADITGLQGLYSDYDAAQGNMTQARHDKYDPVKAEVIHSMYLNTYESADSPMKSIRSELMMYVDKCPYCGFGEPKTLDHVQPRSTFKALSTCRLNLVPLCWRCNNLKGKKDQIFVHPYYQQFPLGKRFFCASAKFSSSNFIFNFFIDPSHITPQLAGILVNQIRVIKLTDRLTKEVNSFIYEQLKSQEFYGSDHLLRIIIKDMMNKSIKDNGLNHWKSASLEPLANSQDLTLNNVAAYLSQIAATRQPLV